MKILLFLYYLIIVILPLFVYGKVDHSQQPLNREEQRLIVILKKEITTDDIISHINSYSKYLLSNSDDGMFWFSFEVNNHKIVGYSANIPEDIYLAIYNDPNVDYIEEDSIYSITTVQRNAPWGLSRTSKRTNSQDEFNYYYEENIDVPIDVYVIDTGVYIEHEDFENRAKWGVSIPRSLVPIYSSNININETDGNGHGTHVAGTIAGKKYGMCKHCQIVAIQVLDSFGTGSLSQVIAGIDWMMKAHKKKKGKVQSVANMSLGAGYSYTLNRVVDSAVEAGIHMVVAAGNSRNDACYSSPSSSEFAITVGATDVYDKMASFSNYGTCMDIFAPGVDILSSWIGHKSANIKISGTSMSSPHVCGAVAAMLSRTEYKGLTPDDMKQVLKKLATKGLIEDIPDDTDTHNHLLYTDAKVE